MCVCVCAYVYACVHVCVYPQGHKQLEVWFRLCMIDLIIIPVAF